MAIGECMAEFAPAETDGEYRLGFAGDTYNTAWYLRKLRPDFPVSYYTAAGTDALSDQMIGAMNTAGIGTEQISRLSQYTVGLYIISLLNGERSFSYWRESSAARHLADERAALSGALTGGDMIYFSGISLAILDEAGRTTLLDALLAARLEGKTIAFDPNLRPRLWSDAGEMTSTIMRGAAVSDIVLPSFEDEADHFGDADPEATATRYAEAGATTVIVKNGPGDVYFTDYGDAGHVACAPVEGVVDTTAAGDSFNAGFLAGADTGLSVRERIVMASRVAGKVIMGKGALVDIDTSESRLDVAIVNA
ncbi:sugar kinase [Amaricoccus macauensis]|uniref:sugar kinase n=1 Tax=Amaricoccus macauensis TaxID=57001 RepID=UPI003C7D405A